MIYKIIRNYRSRWLDEDDMFQEGCIGVIYAYNSYDTKSDMAFDTWVYNCIKWQISKALYGDKKSKDIKLVSANTPINEEDGIELMDVFEDTTSSNFFEVEDKLMYEFYIDEFYRILDGDFLKVMIHMFTNNDYSWSNTSKVLGISKSRIGTIKYQLPMMLRKSAYIRNRLDEIEQERNMRYLSKSYSKPVSHLMANEYRKTSK